MLQESFYYGLSDEEMVHVHDYNFDHPGITHVSWERNVFLCHSQEMCSDFVTAAAPFLISDAFDTDLLLSCMEKLKHGKAVDIPSYDFKTHKSVSCARKVILYKGGSGPKTIW